MIKRIEPPTVDVVNNKTRHTLNEYEFYALRCNIKKENLVGWYWSGEHRLYKIHSTGKCEKMPPQFDMITEFLMELL